MEDVRDSSKDVYPGIGEQTTDEGANTEADPRSSQDGCVVFNLSQGKRRVKQSRL